MKQVRIVIEKTKDHYDALLKMLKRFMVGQNRGGGQAFHR